MKNIANNRKQEEEFSKNPRLQEEREPCCFLSLFVGLYFVQILVKSLDSHSL